MPSGGRTVRGQLDHEHADARPAVDVVPGGGPVGLGAASATASAGGGPNLLGPRSQAGAGLAARVLVRFPVSLIIEEESFGVGCVLT